MLAILVCLYVAFSVLVLTNAAAGLFAARGTVHPEGSKDARAARKLGELLSSCCTDDVGRIDWSAVESALKSDDGYDAARALDVTPTEIAGLFQLLDTGSGLVAIDEIIDGIMRLRGNTKAILVDPAAADASLLARLLGLAAAAAASAPAAAATSSAAQPDGEAPMEGNKLDEDANPQPASSGNSDGGQQIAAATAGDADGDVVNPTNGGTVASGSDASVQMPPSDSADEPAS
jgi:hypothetical protein